MACGACAAADYFPLQVGNQWIYLASGRIAGDPLVVEVTASRTINGADYWEVRGFPGTAAVWLRMTEDGRLLAYDTQLGRELLWADFARPEGETYRTEIGVCNTAARISSRSARVSVPVGEFNNGLEIQYPPSGCADAGLTSEVYLPYVGLAQRTETTFAGPRRWDLVYAELGSVTYVSAPETSFSLAIDKPVYEIGSGSPPQMRARITLRNTTQTPMELTFPSGQSFDLVFRNDRGEEVYRWSNDKGFTLALRRMSLAQGEKNWMVLAPLGEPQAPLKPGIYTAEAWLTTAGTPFRASVGFEVRSR